MSVRDIVLATRSAGKLRELRPLLAGAGYRALGLDDLGLPEGPEEDALECHDTFEENARAKARHFVVRCGGLPVVAEDSGLVVEALAGAPGVRSRRWAASTDARGQAQDDANNRYLVEQLAGSPDRRARYVCVACHADAAGVTMARGETAGVVLHEARGTGGFGYDPFFLSSELGITFGEATPAMKEGVSHRGRAFRALLGQIRAGR